MPSGRRVVLFVALAFAIVASGIVMIPAQAETVNITLFGSAAGGWGYTSTGLSNPGPTIKVTQGDTVSLTLHSVDGTTHNWFIDYNNDSVVSTGEPSSADFTGSTAGTFTFVADRVGTFTYRCRIHPTSMTGLIVIETPPTFELFGQATRGWGEQNTTTAITSPGPRLTVNQSETVTIELNSVDGQPHSWFIDLNNDNIQQSTEPHSKDFSSSVRYTFQVTLAAGNYTYRCQYHPTIMYGTLTVRASGGGTTTAVDTTLLIGGVIIVVAIVAVVAAVMMRRKKP